MNCVRRCPTTNNLNTDVKHIKGNRTQQRADDSLQEYIFLQLAFAGHLSQMTTCSYAIEFQQQQLQLYSALTLKENRYKYRERSRNGDTIYKQQHL